MILKYHPLKPHQTKFISSKARYLLNSGGVGSGKTYSIVLKTLKLIAENPGILTLIGAQTYPLLRDTTLREFLNVIPREIVAEYNKTNQHFKFINGSEVIFRAFDEADKLKSLNLGACGIEEMTDIDEDIFKMLRTRMRQNNMPCCIYGATNPHTFGNWVYKSFIETPIANSEVVYSITMDNKYLPAEYITDLNEMKKANPEYYERMVMGKWGALEGVIYSLPMKNRSRQLPLRYQRYIAGLDFGFTHPTALVVIGCIESNYYIVDELYRHKMTSTDIALEIKKMMEKYNIDRIYCDSARPEIIEDLRRQEIPATDSVKDVFEGIMHVKSCIGDDRLIVNAECKYTLREFDSYIWDKRASVKEMPVKVNDDCMDAVRYALYTDYKRYGGGRTSDMFEAHGTRTTVGHEW